MRPGLTAVRLSRRDELSAVRGDLGRCLPSGEGGGTESPVVRMAELRLSALWTRTFAFAGLLVDEPLTNGINGQE